MAKLWGGRFSKDTDKLVEDFHSSISFDQKLYKWDITGSKAHARMLGKIGVLTEEEAQQIIGGLDEIMAEIEAGQVTFDPSAEDIHMNVEVLLTNKIGAVGKKLHTGRSRNDQVAVDVRMYLRHEIENTHHLAAGADENSGGQSPKNTRKPFCRAIPTCSGPSPASFAHHHGWPMRKCSSGISPAWQDCRARMNVMPLRLRRAGWHHLSRWTGNMVAEELGFDAVCLNIDGRRQRPRFYLWNILGRRFYLLTMHLSRLCEEIILWSSPGVPFY